MIGAAGGRWHCVGNQHETVAPLCSESDAQVRVMNMVTVGYNADKWVGEIERGADHAGFASDRRAHRIEQMGERLRSCLDGGARFLIARLRVSERDEHT